MVFQKGNKINLGKHHSEETKKKISESHIGIQAGEKNPMYGVRLLGEKSGMFGKHHTEETKKKISEVQKGNKNWLGRKHTEETKEKIKQNHADFKGDKCPSWKGGKHKNQNGYILIYKPEHPFNNEKYVFEHRLVIEQFLGRYLTEEEVIHHINGIKTDNRIENLMLFKNQSEHRKYHILLGELCVQAI